jgi:hypothetical protein
MGKYFTSYQTQYFAWQLTRRLYSEDEDKFTGAIMDARVDLNPHQVDASWISFRNAFRSGGQSLTPYPAVSGNCYRW